MAWQAKLKVITVQLWPAGPGLDISDLKYQCNILKIKDVLISVLLSHQSHVKISKQCVLSKLFIYAMFLSHRVSLQVYCCKCTFSNRDIWKLFEKKNRKLKSTSCTVRKKSAQIVPLGVQQLVTGAVPSKGHCGEGGVVQRGLQRERELGDERWVSGSSANDKHLCLVPVSGVERQHKRDRERRSNQRGTDCWLAKGLWNPYCSREPQVYIAYALCYIER